MDTRPSEGPPHPYRPLADVDEIRLLCLEPGARDDAIRCSLKHANLLQKPSYEALSYMWGYPCNEQPVEIDGITCHIRPSLRSALYHLRHVTEDRILWIDALCINQQDINERNHQVTQMGRIYSNASRVVAWLGEPDDASSHALKFLQDFYRDAPKLEATVNQTVHKDALELDHLVNEITGQADRRFWTTVDQATWVSVPLLCFRKYWSRLWIIQELVLASDVLIQCGQDMCSWDALRFYLRELVEGRIGHEDFLTSVKKWQKEKNEEDAEGPFPSIIYELRNSTVSKLIRERDTIKQSRPRLLLALGLEYGASDCFDPRDRIFGFSSFAKSCCREAVPVDYSLQLTDLSKMLVSHHGKFHHLPDTETRMRLHFEKQRDGPELPVRIGISHSEMLVLPTVSPSPSLNFDAYGEPPGITLYSHCTETMLKGKRGRRYLKEFKWRSTSPSSRHLVSARSSIST